ncbi:extensin-like domain-containing protein [Marinibacterium profundimaris]|nr:extensin family protein [Marinibacterium profundimaris]
MSVEVTRSAAATDMLAVAKVPLAAPRVGGPQLPDLRPAPRPVSQQLIAIAARAPGAPVFSPEMSPRPTFRPDSVVQQALFGKRKKRKGSVCGNIDIQGERIGSYGKGGGCHIPDAVRVRSVSGVKLSTSALMTCDTAEALNTWVDKAVQPAFGKRVVEIKVAAHYACRTRNNQSGAKLSEHAKGRAIDISAFTLRNGEQVTVLRDWNRGKLGKALVKTHAAACGIFGTVLGPRSDSFHRDHFHLDTANYRSGAYCR